MILGELPPRSGNERTLLHRLAVGNWVNNSATLVLMKMLIEHGADCKLLNTEQNANKNLATLLNENYWRQRKQHGGFDRHNDDVERLYKELIEILAEKEIRISE